LNRWEPVTFRSRRLRVLMDEWLCEHAAQCYRPSSTHSVYRRFLIPLIDVMTTQPLQPTDVLIPRLPIIATIVISGILPAPSVGSVGIVMVRAPALVYELFLFLYRRILLLAHRFSFCQSVLSVYFQWRPSVTLRH